ncbi:MAG: site-specific integrase [Richelia sp. SM1_7_0]|nr:site-specific integrase [Richelia sp. SM1_7_0]
MNKLKSKNGSVSITSVQGKLLIRLPRKVSNGKQQVIYCGLSDTPFYRKQVQLICWDIEADIENLTLDCTLERYKDALRSIREPQQLIKPSAPDLLEIWIKYAEFKKSSVSQAYYHETLMGNSFKTIQKLPTKALNQQAALKIRDSLLKTRSSDTTKRLLTQFNACCNWAVKSGMIADNPFNGLSRDIKGLKADWQSIDPFTHFESLAIIEAFRKHPKYSGYANFIEMLFLTGMRLGEAIALQWHHINLESSEILINESFDRKFGRKYTTKTGISRKFPCNQQLRDFLIKLRSQNYQSDALLFPSPVNGQVIKLKHFHNVWKGYQPSKKYDVQGIIPELVDKGLVARYRKPYNIRHTFITNCLEKGIPVSQISRWVGNSPEIIYKHYSGIINTCEVPEL